MLIVLAVNVNEMENTRIRRESGKRWTKQDKNLLLSIIAKNPIMFEKPKAQIYYQNIIQENSHFEEYGWKSMRDKMRNLRLGYTKAIDWMLNAGNGLNKDSITNNRAHIQLLCEDFDILQDIFSYKKNIKSLPMNESDVFLDSNIATTLKTEESDDLPVSNLDNNCKCGEEAVDPQDVHSYSDEDNEVETDSSSYSSSIPRKRSRLLTNNSAAYLAEVQIEKMAYLREKLDFMKGIEERKLKLEEEKLAIHKEEIRNNFELNKLKLEREIALRELELKYKYHRE